MRGSIDYLSTDYMKYFYSLTENKEFFSLKTNKERIKFILKWVRPLALFRKEVHRMANISIKEHSKNESKSRKFRAEGINHFRNMNYRNAVFLYQKAILSAPIPSTVDSLNHLCIAFAHKSVAEFKLKEFSSSLSSAEHSLQCCETIELLLQRIHCLKHLRRYSEALDSVEQLIQRIENNSDLKDSFEKLNDLKKDLIEEMKSSDTSQTIPQHSSKTEAEDLDDNGSNLWLHPECQYKTIERKGRSVFANNFLPKDTVVMIERPFNVALNAETRTKMCSNCYKPIESSLWPCSGCDEVVFCDKQCSITAYETYHRYECGLSGLIYSLGHGFAHTYQIISKFGIQKTIESEEQNNSFDFGQYFEPKRSQIKQTANTFGAPIKQDFDTEFECYRSQLSHSSIEDTYTNINEIFRTIQLALLFDYSGQLDFDVEEDFDKFVTIVDICIINMRRVLTNVFGWFGTLGQIKKQRLGSCYCTIAALFNHSCRPNLWWDYKGTKMVFKLCRDAKAGEELCITYGPMQKSSDFINRQIRLKTNYHFECNCEACLSDCKTIFCARCTHCEGPVVYTLLSPYVKRDDRCLECGQKFESLKQTVAKIETLKTRFNQLFNYWDTNYDINRSLKAAQNILEMLLQLVYSKSKPLKDFFKQLLRAYVRHNQYSQAVQCIERCGTVFGLHIDSNDDSFSADILDDLCLLTNCYYMHLNSSRESDRNRWNNCFQLYSKLIGSLKKGKKDSANEQRMEDINQQMRAAIKEKKKELNQLKELITCYPI